MQSKMQEWNVVIAVGNNKSDATKQSESQEWHFIAVTTGATQPQIAGVDCPSLEHHIPAKLQEWIAHHFIPLIHPPTKMHSGAIAGHWNGSDQCLCAWHTPPVEHP